MPMQPRPCAETVSPWVPRLRLGMVMGPCYVYETKYSRFVKAEDAGVMASTLEARRGRPRSPEADEAIRVATVDLLTTDGYANLTMSGVAAPAGVSTATPYRRWRSKLDLVVDVL